MAHNITKHSAKLNDEFDAMFCINEVEYDGFLFYYGTGIVTQDFHIWFGEQVKRAATDKDFDFEGRIKVTLDDGRIGRALISHVSQHDPEFGSKIVFVFQGGIMKPLKEESNEQAN
jgi:hypothetical protein